MTSESGILVEVIEKENIYHYILFYFSVYQFILSFLLAVSSMNAYRNFYQENCEFNHFVLALSNVWCFIEHGLITFFIIGSISWYFIITITLSSTLTIRYEKCF